jgi:hypothetical protein
MTENIEKITCKFIGDFDVADNIVRNGDALCRLSASNEKGNRHVLGELADKSGLLAGGREPMRHWLYSTGLLTCELPCEIPEMLLLSTAPSHRVRRRRHRTLLSTQSSTVM